MNKDHRGFKGKKELTLMGDIKGKRRKKAAGRKTALDNKQTHPTPTPWTIPAAWLAPEPRDYTPRAPWFRAAPSSGLLSSTQSVPCYLLPNRPTFPTLSVPLGHPCPSSYLSGGSLPSPQYHSEPTGLGPQIRAPPPSHPSSAFLFWTHLETTLGWQILTKFPPHSSPGDLE